MNAGSGWPSNRGVAYAKTSRQQAMKLENSDMNNPAGRESSGQELPGSRIADIFTPKR